MGWEYVSMELGRGPFVQPPDDTWVNMKLRCNDLTGKNWRSRRETCPSATLSTTNLTWTDMGAKPCLHGEKPVTNRLSYGPECILLWVVLHVLNVPACNLKINQSDSQYESQYRKHALFLTRVSYEYVLIFRTPLNVLVPEPGHVYNMRRVSGWPASPKGAVMGS
jgi:hypothetical protein